MRDETDRTASLMTPAKLAQLKVRPAPAASPAAWLDKLAADAGSGHIRRLVDLRRQLQNQLRGEEYARLRSACASLAEVAGSLDFTLLERRGWLARATGRAREAVAGFLAQHEQGSRAGDDLRNELKVLERRQQAQGAAIDRSVMEFLVEVDAIEKIIDQGTRWLQDMRNQLRQREAAGGDDEALSKIDEDSKRCELLVARLKELRTAYSASLAVAQQCRETSPRRGAWIESLHTTVEGDWPQVQRKVDEVAEQARAGGLVSADIEQAQRAHAGLTAALQQAASDCASLQMQSQALIDALDGLQEPLRGAT
jgi:hypothetical protein